MQPPYSDWQDSVRRQGSILLTHLLYLEVQNQLQKKGFVFSHSIEDIEKALLQHFWREEIFVERAESAQVSFGQLRSSFCKPCDAFKRRQKKTL